MPLSDAPAAVILDRIAAKLAAIRVADGWFTDAGAHVDLERIDYNEEGDWPMPRICLVEDSRTVTAQSGGALNNSMDIVAEGYVRINSARPERLALRLKHDLTHGLASVRASDLQDIAGAAVTKVEVAGDFPTLRPSEPSLYVIAQARITVTFVTYPPAQGI